MCQGKDKLCPDCRELNDGVNWCTYCEGTGVVSTTPDIFDDFESLTEVVVKSFNSAVKKSQEENKNLGL